MSRSFNNKKPSYKPSADFVRELHNVPFRRENREYCRRIAKYGPELAEGAYPAQTYGRSDYFRNYF